MGNLKTFEFQIVKQTDKQLLDRMEKVFGDSALEVTDIAIECIASGQAESFATFADVAAHSVFSELLTQDTELFEVITFRTGRGITLTIRRRADQVFADKVRVDPPGQPNNQVPLDAPMGKFLGALRRRLHPVDAVGSMHAILGQEVEQQYQRREAELVRLEQLAAGVTEDVSRYRDRIDKEFLAKKADLEKEVAQKKLRLDEEILAQKQEMESREKALEEKLKEVDQRESRFARRGLREDMKKRLAERGEKFELTRGTRNLRIPIWSIAGTLLGVSGIGAVVYAILVGSQIVTTQGDTLALVPLLVKQALATVTFVSTAIFLIRWSNRWFEQHAQEEFRQKRFELDIDRASWLVETVMEWHTEQGDNIPDPLVEVLGRGLFQEQDSKIETLHPADQLASALLGASSSATLKIPGGGEVCIDRKGLRKLAKSTGESQDGH